MGRRMLEFPTTEAARRWVSLTLRVPLSTVATVVMTRFVDWGMLERLGAKPGRKAPNSKEG